MTVIASRFRVSKPSDGGGQERRRRVALIAYGAQNLLDARSHDEPVVTRAIGAGDTVGQHGLRANWGQRFVPAAPEAADICG